MQWPLEKSALAKAESQSLLQRRNNAHQFYDERNTLRFGSGPSRIAKNGEYSSTDFSYPFACLLPACGTSAHTAETCRNRYEADLPATTVFSYDCFHGLGTRPKEKWHKASITCMLGHLAAMASAGLVSLPVFDA